jgi:hypothetical protein
MNSGMCIEICRVDDEALSKLQYTPVFVTILYFIRKDTLMACQCAYHLELTDQFCGGPGSNPGLVMWDFVIDKSDAGTGFLRELRFPLPIYIPSASPRSSSVSPGAGTIGQEWTQCQ